VELNTGVSFVSFKLIGAEGGVEPTLRSTEIKSDESASPSLTKRYEPVFAGLAVVKVSLRLASY
jgi:hypothetical protein